MKSLEVVSESIFAQQAPVPQGIDRLSHLLERFRVRVSLFHSGSLCGTTHFDALPGRAFLHVLRNGSMEVRHPPDSGLKRRIHLSEPTLLFYPRPVQHTFINPPIDGSDFVCATLDFDGGDRNPLVSALPNLICIALDKIDGLASTLELLFAETDRNRCGSKLLADRLLEVILVKLLRWLLDHPEQAGISAGLLMGLADPRLAKALVALHRAPGEAWSLPRMAAEAGMSRSAFAATFKERIGVTPGEYLSNWRLTLVTAMLRMGHPLKIIAADLGYASSSVLSKAFKHRFRMSPRDWALLHSNSDQWVRHD